MLFIPNLLTQQGLFLTSYLYALSGHITPKLRLHHCQSGGVCVRQKHHMIPNFTLAARQTGNRFWVLLLASLSPHSLPIRLL